MASSHRNILITGANKGVGRATVAAVLGAHDDTFVFLGSRDKGRGETTRNELVAEHPDWANRIEVVPLDVSDDASVKAAAEHVRATLGDGGTLYGLVNNAGIGYGHDMKTVVDVNAYGPRRVCETFMPLLAADGRIANVASAAGPNFVSRCSAENQKALTSPDVTWADVERIIDTCLSIEAEGGDFGKAGLDGEAYGLSKAALIAYTIELARRYPERTINACTPGFIETDLTRAMAKAQNRSPADMGMLQPAEGTRATMHLLFGDVGGTGWYFGSDAQRSPLDRYRSPGDPPYTGD